MGVTVTDNDAVPTSVSLSVNPATVAENARATAVTATLNSGAFTIPTAVTVSVGTAGATEGEQDKSSKIENLFLLRENGRLIWRKAWVSSSSAF